MGTPITSEQLTQYDKRIKEYIRDYVDEHTTNSDNSSDDTNISPPMLRSIKPETIVVQEDIEEDYVVYDRIISPNENAVYRNVVVTSDDRSNRLWFSMWKTFDNRDLFDKRINVIWINADNEKGETECEDVQVIGDRLYFSWNVPLQATQRAGIIRFAIRIIDEDYAWHTLPAEVECVQGLMDADWADYDPATIVPSWVAYIENKYMVGIQILSRADYDALEIKSPKILYLVLETDGSISQYLCTTPANLIKFESLG